MEKYAIFTDTKFVPTHELSVSLKIVEREDVLEILKIVREWVNSIYPNSFIVYCKGSDVSIANFTMYLSPKAENQSKEMKHIGLVPVFCPSNIKFRIGVFEIKYTARRVNNQ